MKLGSTASSYLATVHDYQLARRVQKGLSITDRCAMAWAFFKLGCVSQTVAITLLVTTTIRFTLLTPFKNMMLCFAAVGFGLMIQMPLAGAVSCIIYGIWRGVNKWITPQADAIRSWTAAVLPMQYAKSTSNSSLGDLSIALWVRPCLLISDVINSILKGVGLRSGKNEFKNILNRAYQSHKWAALEKSFALVMLRSVF